MVSLLERDPRPLQAAQAHLEHYMETEVRQQKRRDRPAVRVPTGKSLNSKSI